MVEDADQSFCCESWAKMTAETRCWCADGEAILRASCIILLLYGRIMVPVSSPIGDAVRAYSVQSFVMLPVWAALGQ